MSKLKLLLPLVLMSSTLSALEGSYNVDLYSGFEAKIRKMGFKKNFGNHVFKNDIYESLNAFVGFKLNQYFGIEAAYEFPDTKMRARYIKNGSCVYGFNVLDKIPDIDHINNFFNSRAKVYSYNVNLVGFLPLNASKSVNVITSFGIGHLKSNIKYDLFEIAEKNITLDDQSNIPVQRFCHTRSKYKRKTFILSLKSGIQYYVNNHFGIRALVGLENTHKVKVQGKDRDTGNKVNEHAKFKDSISYSAGFFIPF